MCYHSRLVFGCSHHAWLGVSRPCELEKAFGRGEVNTGCSTKWSHGFDTTRIPQKCRRCVRSEARQGYRLSVVKNQIKALKEQLQMIRGVPASTDDGEGRGLASEPDQNDVDAIF
ncbi:hypothetical protein BT67DRAFT_444524 [Trichocladium antarcticum]|uniref:Uncharacterized protein n=1 Tax=Trichocladium antarcticum TaxID=1450529 RepID=A0AAN6ZB39_9PEZI|nr:hypothetical protein BT67DRAFT_444524 [Trichocladium antarcticum]